jgi:ankyrin repeat protein
MRFMKSNKPSSLPITSPIISESKLSTKDLYDNIFSFVMNGNKKETKKMIDEYKEDLNLDFSRSWPVTSIEPSIIVYIIKDILDLRQTNNHLAYSDGTETLLSIAIEKEYTSMVELLLESKADPNKPIKKNLNAYQFVFTMRSITVLNYVPLFLSIQRKNERIAALLVEYGADVNAEPPYIVIDNGKIYLPQGRKILYDPTRVGDDYPHNISLLHLSIENNFSAKFIQSLVNREARTDHIAHYANYKYLRILDAVGTGGVMFIVFIFVIAILGIINEYGKMNISVPLLTFLSMALTGIFPLLTTYASNYGISKTPLDVAKSLNRTDLVKILKASTAQATASSPESKELKRFPDSPHKIDEVGELKISLKIPFQSLTINYDEKLGKGAYGTVYSGIYQYNSVAIKKFDTEVLSQEAQSELRQEAGIMAMMRSDNLVQLRGICLEAPHFCLVMELMPKGSLYDVLKSGANLPLTVKYKIALNIVSGLAQLHDNNIVHRDLKSLNILLNNTFEAKIADFGLAKVKSEIASTSETKGLVGTLGWAAPELFNERPRFTKSADIYAFAMVLWELTIHPYRIPFHGLVATSLVAAKLSRGDRQETISGTCPPGLAEIIQSGWKKAEERPTARSLITNLSDLFRASENPLTSQPRGILQNSNLLTAAPST